MNKRYIIECKIEDYIKNGSRMPHTETFKVDARSLSDAHDKATTELYLRNLRNEIRQYEIVGIHLSTEPNGPFSMRGVC